MKTPRFTLLQLLGLITISGIVLCVATIDIVGSAIAFGIFMACLLGTFLVHAVFYLASRVVAEAVALVFSRPAAVAAGATTFPTVADITPTQSAEAEHCHAAEEQAGS